MPDPKKRIVVDGVDFGTLFQFQRVLRSATSALQPPRLIVALLMVVALIAFGRGWDGLTEPSVSAAGLLAGETSVEQVAEAQDLMWRALDAYGEADAWPREARLDPRDVLPVLDRAYRLRRTLRETGPPGIEADDASVMPRRLREDDRDYRSTRAEVAALAPLGAFEALSAEVTNALDRTVQGVIYLRPQSILEAGTDLLVRTPVALWRSERTFLIVFGLLFVVIASVGGGALCRMAACEFAGQERLRVRDAMDFALGNWLKLVLTPLLPLLIAGGVALIIVVLGLFLAPWLDIAGGLLYGVAILFGFLLAFLLIGYAVGFPLLIPAVAAENCDAADAQQRAYAYVLNRPLHLLGYGVVALVGLALGYVVVSLVAVTMLNFTASLAGALTGSSALAGAGGFALFDLHSGTVGDIHGTWHDGWAATLIGFWQRLVVDLVAAYVVAYLCTSSTIVYLLMRRACDGQDVEEIWRPGLTPGTLVPLPQPRTSDGTRDAGVAERVISGALRSATAMRYPGGDEEEDGDADSTDDATEEIAAGRE